MHYLGIAIPVYKRPHLLDKCLESIIVQLAKEIDVAIFIYDDSCDDTNLHVIGKHLSNYKFIYHIRNKSNLGICLNIQKALAESIAEYIWLIGEDDIFLDGSIRKICSIIAGSRPAFIYAEYSYISNDYTQITKNKVLNYTSSGLIPSGKFYEECSWAIGFIGSCIIHKDVIKNGLSLDCIDTYFNHVWIILRAMHGKYVYITIEPMILNRAEGGSSTTWSDQSFKVYEGFYTVLIKLGAVYGHVARNRALVSIDEKLGCFKFHNLFYCRFNGFFNTLKMSTIIESNVKTINKIKTIIVIMFPRITYKITKAVIRAIKLKRLFR